MQIIYNLVARRTDQRIVLSLIDPLSEMAGPMTPLRFARVDGIEVLADIYWQTETPVTKVERNEVIARIHRIAERDAREPIGPDWDGSADTSSA